MPFPGFFRSLPAVLFACLTTAFAGETRSIATFGAVPDGKTLNTAAIQRAIDETAEAGGGVVEIPPGTWRSGSIFLKKDVKLYLAEGSILLGSDRISDYARQETRIEGHFESWPMALVNANGLQGVEISGKGVLDGNGIPYWARFWQRRRENPKCTNLEVERPRLVFIDRCRDVRITGVTLRYSGFWNLHLYRCSQVLIEDVAILAPTRLTGHRNYMTKDVLSEMDRDSLVRNLPVKDNILGPSTDGIDIDSSRDVTVRKCFISVNDDNIALKGSKGPLADQDQDSPPVENILVEDCEFGDGNGVITCGSEATLVRNVTVRNCRITGDATLLTLKLRPDTPQRYENIVIDGITLAGEGRILNVAPWTQFFDLKGHAPPARSVSGISIRNVTGSFRAFGRFQGNPGDILSGVRFGNMDLKLAEPGLDLGGIKDFSAVNVSVNGKPWLPD